MGKSSENHGKTWEILGQSHGGVDSSENLPQIEDIPDIPAGYVRFYTRGYHSFFWFSIGHRAHDPPQQNPPRSMVRYG